MTFVFHRGGGLEFEFDDGSTWMLQKSRGKPEGTTRFQDRGGDGDGESLLPSCMENPMVGCSENSVMGRSVDRKSD